MAAHVLVAPAIEPPALSRPEDAADLELGGASPSAGDTETDQPDSPEKSEPTPSEQSTAASSSPPVKKLPPAAPGATPRLEALDGPRWVASSFIIAYHFYGFKWGATWTQFFFFLSGFVLSYLEMTRRSKPGKEISPFAYVRRRLGTLYPTYVFAIVLVQFQIPGNAMDLAVLPLHLLLLQAYVPLTYVKSGTWRWVGTQWTEVAWFVSVLVIYWFLLRPITRRVQGWSLRRCCWTALALWAWSIVIYALGNLLMEQTLGCTASQNQKCAMQWTMPLLYQGWLGFLHVFVGGIVTARIFILTSTCDAETGERPTEGTRRFVLDKERAPWVIRYGMLIGYALFALAAFGGGEALYEPFHFFWHNGGILPAMALVLLGGSVGVDPLAKHVFQSQLFLVLGRLSYAQYLLQFRVWFAMEPYFGGVTLEMKLIFPFVLIASAYLTERYITRVFNEWQKYRTEKGEAGIDDKVVALLERAYDRMTKPSVSTATEK